MDTGVTEQRTASGLATAPGPRHVAIIMDGNGRWARAKGLPRVAGHRAGTENLRNILRAARDFGVEIVTLYAFSTENWQRPRTEVRALLALMEHVIDAEINNLDAEGVQIRHIGRTDGVSSRLVAKIVRAQERTAHNSRLILNIAFNYGGRAEIVDAVRRIVAEGLQPEEISEESVSDRLSTAGLPDPDLVIRTGGDMRLSNFMIWQLSYAEFYCTPTFWPDFGREDLRQAIEAFRRRERRYGRIG
ncbi:MAG: di-trans,poly-cis-decaprenylcistransferase [Chloroflexi bacterium]|nr:di-trans,poly-cis-decaprenylcistransferase [Chloroflexota bacterium]